jgi:hypothetical protein
MQTRRRRVSIWSAAAVLALAAIGIAVAMVPDNEVPIEGEALARASAAALQHTGGGSVTETEVGDEDGYYEVEVTLSDGTQVDVHLDQDFKVIDSKSDKDDGEVDE